MNQGQLVLLLLGSLLLCLVSGDDGGATTTTTTVGGSSEVLKMQESLTPSIMSYARWKGTIPRPLKEITICYRIKIYHYRPEVVVFSYINTKNENIRTDHNRKGVQVVATAQGMRVDTGIITPLMHWTAFCFVLAPNTPLTFYHNGLKWKGDKEYLEDDDDDDDQSGKKLVSISNSNNASQVFLDVDGTIVLGQDQDAPADVYDVTQSFSGELTDLNVWSRRLEEQELADISGCRTRGHGDIIDWDTADFELGSDVSKVEVDLAVTCNVVPLPFFMFPDKLQVSDALSLCAAFGGDVVTPRNAQEQEVVYKLGEENKDQCAKEGGPLMWLGITDDAEKGVWRYYSSGENVNYTNWAPGQPNGLSLENCAVLKGETFLGGWSDQSCKKSYKVCVLCSLKMPVFLRFRGICDSSLYDDRFVLVGKVQGKPYFKGYYRSHVYFTADRIWRLESILKNNTYAEMEDDGSLSFPVGRNDWTFSHGFCGRAKGEPQSLTFTQCAKNFEFTCDDGTCININQVCDRRVQCPDTSDELDCSTVKLPKGYQTTLPPPSLTQESPLPVYLNLTLNTFGSIDAIRNRFTVELMVRMIWKDQRLQFKHLRRDRQLNIILPSEAQNIWVPTVDFLNAENNQHTTVDADCKITIKRQGSPIGDNIEHSKEARIYKGEDNYIRIARTYTIVFHCNFNFFYFPFNTDYCQMIFRINKNTNNYVTLEKYGAGIRYQGKDQLAEYTIGGVKMERLESDEPYSGLVTHIQMRHLYTTQIVTIFVPTTLINLISFATFLFKWFDFQNRIMVSLTALLVLSTLFSQISGQLPKTSYSKLIDMWFLSSIVFAFVTIIIHTIVEINHHYNSPTESSKFRSPPSPTTLSLPRKVVPTTVESTSRNSMLFLRRNKTFNFKPKNPGHLPALINKVAYTLVFTAYIIIFLMFWSVAFSQKIAEDKKVFEVEETEVTGYPA
ncbi:hypothetical protein Pcinc_019858 [Petrolisthes cinctipes]|uniref:Uncharacterized protein n=1 Tax=Petrolisthes cinctipes TaxID=88211 RepID=A0AAE1KJS6_PETCI|nr:hypothetical protein Pcinc_019858 [Petrolisthes cinctipes]